MKTLSSYPGCDEVQSALSEISEVSTRAGFDGTIYLGKTGEAYHIFMAWSHYCRLYLLTANLVLLKRENPELFLIVEKINGGNSLNILF